MALGTPVIPVAARRPLLAALLLLSGAAALLHETAWFRLLAPIAGVGTLPAAAVAAGALLGLAAGAALGGRLADLSGRPLLVLAFAEGAAAGLGGLVPLALSGLPPGTGALAPATAVLALAALPWGVSIPAAVRSLRPDPESAADEFRRAYAWNTAGALLGIAAGAAWLLEALGNRATVAAASGLQFLAALLALALGPGAPREAVPTAPAPEKPREAPPAPALLLLAAALAGAAGVGSQVAWVRRLAPVLCATFPVFAAVLAVHVGGIALGTALLGPRQGLRPGRSVAVLAVAGAAATAGTPFLLAAVVGAVRPLWWDARGDPLAVLGLRVAVPALLVLPGVLAGAALLPWLVRRAAPDGESAGRWSGRLLAANSAGAAAGGFAVALWLVPAAGTAASLGACGAALLLAGAAASVGRGRLVLAGLAAALGLVPALRPFGDRAAVDAVGALYTTSSWMPRDTLTLLAEDGRNASVVVRDREGRIEFWIEGSLEASNWPTDRLHLGLLGHLPLVLFEARAERPPRVVLVGLGAGFTARAAERHSPASLVVHELEPAVVRASERFRALGGGVPATATVAIGDGRRAVLGGGGPVDVLSSDPVHPAVAGSAFLYSAEYYRGAMARLSPEGILVQWLPLYQLHGDDLRLALRTFAAEVAFPYVFLAGRDALLVGSRTPLRLPPARLARALASPAAADLRAQGLGSPGALLALLALDPEGCRAVAGEGEVNTDDRLLLELRAGWREADDEGAAHVLLSSRPADPRSLLDGPPDAAFEADLEGGRGLAEALEAWVRLGPGPAQKRFAAIAGADPSNAFAAAMRDEAEIERAWALLESGAAEAAARVARGVAAREGAEPIRRLDAAEILFKTGNGEEARAIARPFADLWPRARRLAR